MPKSPTPEDLGTTLKPARAAEEAPLSELSATLKPSHRSEIDPTSKSVTTEHPGRYDVRGEIGRGGMGRVLVAFDEHVGREIAIKEVLDPDDAASTAVFLREARVTGQLEHPNIVPVYEVGRSTKGQLYYTMRLLRGQTLATALGRCQGLKDRLQFLGTFWDLCKAVSFVHSRGVVHRDLKPGNVMVGEYGETILLDWGLAKVLKVAWTQSGRMHVGSHPDEPEPAGVAVGSPAYMSPEQALGQNAIVDEQSDVWGLGAVLYEVLTGQPPFEGKNIEATLDMVANTPLVPVRTRCPAVQPELAAITEKALSKDRAGRYQSAKELTAEIQAYMTGGRVRAHAYSNWELVARAVRQNWLAVLGFALALLTLVALLVEVSLSRAEERHAHLQSELHLAQAHQERATKAFEDNDLERAQTFTARSLLHNPAHPLARSFDAAFAQGSADARQLRVDSASMLLQARLRSVAHLEGALAAPDGLWGVAISADGSLIAAGATARGEIYLWDRASGKLLQTLAATRGSFTPIALSPDGRLLASGGRGSAVVVWDPRTGERKRELEGPPSGSFALAFSADGALLGSANFDGSARVWETASGRLVAALEGHGGAVESVAFSPDAALVATASRDRTVRLWSLPQGALLASLESASGPVLAAAFSPDGRLLATAGEERVVRFYSVPEGRPVRLLSGHRDAVSGLAFSPAGQILVSLGGDGVRAWDLRTGATLSVLEGAATDRGVAFSRDGERLALAGDSRTVRVFHLNPEPAYASLVGHPEPINDVSFTPDGRRLVTSSSDRSVRVWDLAAHAPAQRLLGHFAAVYRHAVSPDGTRLATVSRDRTLRLWDLGSGEGLRTLEIGDSNTAVAFSPDGRILATGGPDNAVRLRDGATGEQAAALEGHTGAVVRLAFSPDGRRLASASKDGTVRVWDVPGRAPLRAIEAHADWAWAVAFSPDGALLASAGKDGRVVLWDAATGAARRTLTGPGKWVNDVRFSADGAVLATCGDDWTARLWDVATGAPRLVLRAAAGVDALALSPDGRSLALASGRVAELYTFDLAQVLEVDPRPLAKEADPAR